MQPLRHSMRLCVLGGPHPDSLLSNASWQHLSPKLATELMHSAQKTCRQGGISACSITSMLRDAGWERRLVVSGGGNSRQPRSPSGGWHSHAGSDRGALNAQGLRMKLSWTGLTR